MAAHARLPPSASERWIACPGSIALSDGLPNESSVYAWEGTCAHTLGEQCLRNGFNADRFLGWYADDQGIRPKSPPGKAGVEITEEMAEAVQLYLDTCRAEVKPGDEWAVEERVYLNDEIYGTADFYRYRAETKHLLVADYKHGRGVSVEVQDNTQALIYAVGALNKLNNRGVAAIEVVIVQPRNGGVKRATYTPVELLEWWAGIEQAAQRTKLPDAPLVPGDHCRFCPAAGICTALRQRSFEIAQMDFSDTGEIVTTNPESYSPDELGKLLGQIDLVEVWLNRVREFAHHEATRGRCPPGWKLVQSRPVRKWKSEDEAKPALIEYGLDEKDLYDSKFKSPAGIEKVIGKKNAGDIAHLVEKVSSKTVLAPLDDPREPYWPSAETEFGPAAGFLD